MMIVGKKLLARTPCYNQKEIVHNYLLQYLISNSLYKYHGVILVEIC